jgi:hypothetical protein
MIGMVSGAAGALPGIVWFGGMVLSVVLFPPQNPGRDFGVAVCG